MNQQELLRLLVLVEIADDYEEANHVYDNVAKRAAACGIAANRQSVYLLLLELVEQGLARSYVIRQDPIVEFDGVPKLDQIEGYCFFRTDKGLEIFLAAREAGPWPFDDEGDLVPGWRSFGQATP
jgi:hypothetical protein